MSNIHLSRLTDPFPPEDVEWRIGRAGKKGDKVWAKVLAYITNRAIMERLDDVCGPANWKNDYREGPGGGVLCGIGIYIEGEWIWKWDGAENTEIESVKGGLSGSMKRAAVQWGVGRYLYNLDEGWADVHKGGEHYARLPKDKGGDSFRWDPPDLPAWALPNGQQAPVNGQQAPVSGQQTVDPETGEVDEVPAEMIATARGLMDLASNQSAIDDAQAARVEEAIQSGETERVERAIDWLRERTPNGNPKAKATA